MKIKNDLLKSLFLIIAFCFTIPTLIYFINGNTVFLFMKYFKFFLNDTNVFIRGTEYLQFY